ncbi:UDP-N-acetylmuramoyl-L-alanine--D-glutamate ligase [Aliibacillus thermotolerans]|uniref:UDP-N-acetylmuramoylalanine--D-glutamate ligase n=1 Tax=Aliibacillus thermotolerans TaxID=1834418 RepID=A0ABW0U3K3_9BACI|nr:UDP-N-acetylmuramoyl-L-alanine--D-glutamate ligase [Aliibacillus thermotolerans]MDA3131005.1 UDP-N-acetylmuramoyl-L-alanine--D-glutamate ligase [Aliibacillus thermotolerans]
MMDKHWFQGKHVLVLGLAKSGYHAALLLLKLGAHVTVNDAKDITHTEEARHLMQKNVDIVSGGHPRSLMERSWDYVVKNPGIPYHNPLVQEAQKQGIPVVTEIELASFVCKGEIVAITGTNGKTTTTTLIYHMLKEGNCHPHLAGNIGLVASDVAKNVKEDEVMVTEVSSFQLKGTQFFHPKTAILLNISDAHLDYHGTREDYEMSKAKIFQRMTAKDTIIYNADDPAVSRLVKDAKGKLLPFSLAKKINNGGYKENGAFYFQGKKVMEIEEVSLPGAHNEENMLAAICASLLHGASLSSIQQVLRTFQGVEHRLQYVGNVAGRKVYNDSKATNIESTEKALTAFSDPIVLIGGGLDRGVDFSPLIPSLAHVKAAVFYGETKEQLKATAVKANVPRVKTTETLEEAVKEAFSYSTKGDIVLLSPACASWDQFNTFEERGKTFIHAVQQLAGS